MCLFTCWGERVALAGGALPPEQPDDDEDDEDEDEKGDGQPDVESEVGRPQRRRLLGGRLLSVTVDDDGQPLAGHHRWPAHAAGAVLADDVLPDAVAAPVAGRGAGARPPPDVEAVGGAG